MIIDNIMIVQYIVLAVVDVQVDSAVGSIFTASRTASYSSCSYM